ncbi:MAG: putative toxin-antitoxin system toxin component, PIN family [Thaumarchaeota archaeon RBG_16_49_8]|nr:MAG: putative toxin-antitoxin system toxin component, PIN family [Thaumarchaeota archaeon RBG_16_49_8]
MTRVVIDTNILISALLGAGKTRQLVQKLLRKHTVILSRPMLAEVTDVLSRDKFAEIKNQQTDRFISNLEHRSKIVNIRSNFKIVKEDPDDDIVLNTAYSGKADYIVTGDNHLLTLKEFKRTKIIDTNQMLNIGK